MDFLISNKISYRSPFILKRYCSTNDISRLYIKDERQRRIILAGRMAISVVHNSPVKRVPDVRFVDETDGAVYRCRFVWTAAGAVR
ncbi:hypothetical protein KM043_010865 [Ampulex compressa]|nr:hypothetical protein KM043_010865 [Ampulex compressa]